MKILNVYVWLQLDLCKWQLWRVKDKRKKLWKMVSSRYFFILRGVVDVTFYSKMSFSALKWHREWINFECLFLAPTRPSKMADWRVQDTKKVVKMVSSRCFLILRGVVEVTFYSQLSFSAFKSHCKWKFWMSKNRNFKFIHSGCNLKAKNYILE